MGSILTMKHQMIFSNLRNLQRFNGSDKMLKMFFRETHGTIP